MKIRPTRQTNTQTEHNHSLTFKFASLSFSFCRAVNPQLSSPHTATRCLFPVSQKNCARWIENSRALPTNIIPAAANIFYSSSSSSFSSGRLFSSVRLSSSFSSVLFKFNGICVPCVRPVRRSEIQILWQKQQRAGRKSIAWLSAERRTNAGY